jgi:hypothetical protein
MPQLNPSTLSRKAERSSHKDSVLTAVANERAGAMWTTLQDQSFLLGAALVTLVHATKFGELNLGNPVTGRYLALLPGAKVRDFVGPYAYHISLFAFLGVSLISYYLCCQISPNILNGATKILGNVDADKTFQDVPYPLYVAALFIGLTQPVVPVFSRFGDAQRNFFHDQIEVPGRIIKLAERLTSHIEARDRGDKRHLAREAQHLVGGEVLATVQTYGDIVFYKLQLERLGFADQTAFDKTIRESSRRELRGLIERLVFCTLVAVMRQSGTKAVSKVADAIGIPSAVPGLNNLGYLLTGIAASGMVFSLCILTTAHIFALLAGPVARLFSKSLDQSLWPSNLEYVGDELWTIVPPIFVCLIIAVTFLVPREPAKSRNPTPLRSSLIIDLMGFFRSGISIFVACIVVSLLIKFAQLFYEYGTFHLPKEALSSARLLLPVVQSFIPVAVCLFTTWYLSSRADDGPRHPIFFVGTLLAMAGTVVFLAVLYDLTFLSEYLRVRPQDGPGWEHLLFSVVANAVVSACAFVSLVLFFRSRNILQKPASAPQRQRGSAIGSAVLSERDLQPQRALRTGDHRGIGAQAAGRSTNRRSTHMRPAMDGHGTGASLDLNLGDGHVEPA